MAVGCSVERLRRTTAAVVCIGLDVCLRLFMFVYVCLNFLGRLTSGKPDLRVCLCLFMFIYEAAAGKRKTLTKVEFAAAQGLCQLPGPQGRALVKRESNSHF